MRIFQRLTIHEGKIEDCESLFETIRKKAAGQPDGEYILEVTATNRSDAQNRFYWVVLNIIANAIGWASGPLHKLCKEKFLPEQEYFVLVKSKKVTSTTELTKDEMAEYLDKVIRLAAEQGIVIPDPEDYKHHQ